MEKDEKRKFRDFILREQDRPLENDPIQVVRRIALHSKDVRAQLMSIRMLARELGSATPPNMETTAKWSVIREGPGTTKEEPSGAGRVQTHPPPRTPRARREDYHESGHG